MNTSHQEKHVRVGGFLKEAVFGFNDGVVSTFAVIAGLTGGLADQKVILLAALATLFAGAFSMGLGTYLGSKSEKDLYENEMKREKYEMKHMAEVEKQEIREIYAELGFKGQLLEDVVKQITNDPHVWLKTMMMHELGFAEKPPKPGLNGITMSVAFIIGALIPAFPYFFPRTKIMCFNGNCPEPVATVISGMPALFALSLGLSAVGLIIAGAIKTRFTGKNVVVGALETLLIGSLAAAGTYGIGLLFV